MTEHMTADRILIRKLTEIILANLENKDFGVQELALQSGVSRTGLNRKLRKIADKSLNQFINEVRLRKALEILLDEEMTASEVAYKVGFSSPAYFNTCFHKCFGFPPGKVKESVGDKPEEYLVANILPEQKQIRQRRRISAMKSLVILSVMAFIAFAAYNFYAQNFRGQTIDDLRSSDGRLSIAVMPFQNNSNDSLLNVWQDGIQEILITSLSNSEDLKVQQTKLISSYLQSKGLSSYASITPAIASTISKKLDASILIIGGIKQFGSILRLNAQLIDSQTDQVIKSFQIDGNSEMLMYTIDSLSVMIRNYLEISKLGKGEGPAVFATWMPHTNSPEAYRYHLVGAKAYAFGDYVTAKKWFLKSVEIDSNFFMPAFLLSASYWPLGQYDSAKYWCQKLYNEKGHLNIIDQIRINFMYTKCFGTDFEAIKYLTQLTEMDKNDVIHLSLLGLNYSFVFQYDKAIPVLERELEIYDEWRSKPYWPTSYTLLGKAYHETGQYKKERRLYKDAEQYFPDQHSIIYRQTILELTDGDTTSAIEYTKKYMSILKERSVREAWITLNLARIYSEAGILDKAEGCFRKALDSEPYNITFIHDLAYFLIDNEINIDEGIELVDKVIGSGTDKYYGLLHVKGWGLFKKGKNMEALEILQKSWDLRMQIAVYNHTAFLHLEEAKKAVRDQKTVAF